MLAGDDERLASLVEDMPPGAEPLYAAGAPAACDLCERPLESSGFYVDGKLRQSMQWANLCARCALQRGEGIGWNRSQLFERQEDGKWRLIAGFPPARKDS